MIRRLPILPTILVAAAVATMIALGVWQWNKRAAKEVLIARYEQAQSMSSTVPWPRTEPELERSLFRWSSFTCDRVLDIRSGAGTSADGEKGWQHIARCAIDGGGEAEVALGWSSGPTPPRWHGGDVNGIISLGGVLRTSPPAAGLQPLEQPDPSETIRPTPAGHLAYAGQWFFFALTALVIYVLALRRRQS